MFTGIIEELGEVAELARFRAADGEAATLTVRATRVSADLTHGASIAVNGVCLTVVGWQTAGAATAIGFDVMAETLARSVIGELSVGEPVNLERAVRAEDRLGGHLVQGHVDGSATIRARTPGAGWETVRFEVPRELGGYLAEKGSVAVDGVSLTITAVSALPSAEPTAWFEVGLIPETLRATTLGHKGVGARVNIEVDVVAKYLERLGAAAALPPGSPLTREQAR